VFLHIFGSSLFYLCYVCQGRVVLLGSSDATLLGLDESSLDGDPLGCSDGKGLGTLLGQSEGGSEGDELGFLIAAAKETCLAHEKATAKDIHLL
jgi:hypothetical protein